MKRKIYDELVKWKDNPNKKCLLIEGARQVGKTYIVREFAKNNYNPARIIEINFENYPDASLFFMGDRSPETILNKIQKDIRYKDVYFDDLYFGPLFIFLDEIQRCPDAITALKFFSEKNNIYHVIASGSLLGVTLNNKVSYPVGYVEHVSMYPLDFEEFLWAMGMNERYVNNLKETFYDTTALTKPAHDNLIAIFRQYIALGGLPGVINAYLTHKSYELAYDELDNLYKGYTKDINQYVEDNSLKIRIEECFKSIPNQLKEQNKKFIYKRVSVNGRARMYEGAIDWLKKAGLVIKCNNLKKVADPLSVYINEDYFKLYLFDTGILVSMFGLEKMYAILNGKEDFDIGGIYENAIASIIAKYEKNNQIKYYSEGDSLDIDFVTKEKENILCVEVKSGNNLKSVSLNKFSERNYEDKNISFIKTSGKLVKDDGIVKNIPFYAFALIGTRKD